MFRVFRVFRVSGFRGLGFRGVGFRMFRVHVVRALGKFSMMARLTTATIFEPLHFESSVIPREYIDRLHHPYNPKQTVN